MNKLVSQVIRSDELPALRSFLERFDTFQTLFPPIKQFEVIIDASVVISDLIWLTKHRKKKDARSSLQELIDSETVIPYAPSVLKEEVHKRLLTVSKEQRISLNNLEAEWEKYAKTIVFEDSPNQSHELTDDIRDPNDLPYISLQLAKNASIYTRDKDFSSMGGATIDFHVVARLRDYSRHAAIEYTIKSGGVVVAVISGKLVELLFSFVKSLAAQIGKLPSWVWLIACGVLIVALLHPTSRKAVITFISTLPVSTKEIGLKIVEFTKPFVIEHYNAKEQAEAALDSVTAKV